MDVTSLMRQAARLNASRVAIATNDRTLTFSEAWERGVRLANALIDLGVEPGDRVAGLEDNTLGCVDTYLACAIAGATRVPLYAKNSRSAHRDMLEGTDCKVLVAEAAYRDDVLGLEDEVASLTGVVLRDESYEDWLVTQSPVDPVIEIDPDSWYVIRHSGGTTGRPKGVAYSYHDWVLNCRNWTLMAPRLTRNSVMGHAGPVSHASGYFFLPAWLVGATNVMFGAFEPVKVLAMMREHRVTHMFVSPSLLSTLARHPDAVGDWPHLEALVVGGAPIADATALHARDVFGNVLHQGFGQTEAVPISSMGPEDWFAEIEGSEPMRSAGRVMPYAQVRIVGADGVEVPLGEDGEIVARVEGQMRSYWGAPELTATRLKDGWIYTQDIGCLDTNGFLYIRDRVDDMIVSGGFNIWPAELEAVLSDHPAVVEAAVFGVPHEQWGETPMAVVTVTDPSAVTAEELVALCKERLGSYKKPTRIEITTEPLPKTLVGKVARKDLRAPHWEGRERKVGGV